MPVVTSFLVGLQGASVPSPICIIAETDMAIKSNPPNITIRPVINAGIFLTMIIGSIHNGMRISTVTGRINDNTCLKNLDIY